MYVCIYICDTLMKLCCSSFARDTSGHKYLGLGLARMMHNVRNRMAAVDTSPPNCFADHMYTKHFRVKVTIMLTKETRSLILYVVGDSDRQA